MAGTASPVFPSFACPDGAQTTAKTNSGAGAETNQTGRTERKAGSERGIRRRDEAQSGIAARAWIRRRRRKKGGPETVCMKLILDLTGSLIVCSI